MLEYVKHRPKQRSKLRLMAGKWWFTSKRHMKWMTGRTSIAKRLSHENLEYAIFSHATPLYRDLRDVDMWLHTNKITNLKLAAKKLDGLLLQPGETFSYWRTIGNPTRRKGYVDGMILFYGGFKTGTGGGLCQMSNLIYWMTLHTPLKVTERHRHSYDVFPDAARTQPFGSGATCVYNYLDLQIYNPTSALYQLRIRLTETELVGEWRSVQAPRLQYEVYEKEHRISSQPWGGYMRSNIIYRRSYNQYDELFEDEYITENHALMMYAPLLGQEND
ncbi:Vancomycin B-type resistance protein VanW [compost metagenome]